MHPPLLCNKLGDYCVIVWYSSAVQLEKVLVYECCGLTDSKCNFKEQLSECFFSSVLEANCTQEKKSWINREDTLFQNSDDTTRLALVCLRGLAKFRSARIYRYTPAVTDKHWIKLNLVNTTRISNGTISRRLALLYRQNFGRVEGHLTRQRFIIRIYYYKTNLLRLFPHLTRAFANWEPGGFVLAPIKRCPWSFPITKGIRVTPHP